MAYPLRKEFICCIGFFSLSSEPCGSITRSPIRTVGGFITFIEIRPEQDVKRLNSKRPPEKSDGLFGFNPNLGASRNNAVSHTAKKGGVWMPDIRRMGDDFVVIINGVLVRFESRDAAYAAWEENE